MVDMDHDDSDDSFDVDNDAEAAELLDKEKIAADKAAELERRKKARKLIEDRAERKKLRDEIDYLADEFLDDEFLDEGHDSDES